MKKTAALVSSTFLVSALLVSAFLAMSSCSTKSVKPEQPIAQQSFGPRDESKNSIYGRAITTADYQARFKAHHIKKTVKRSIASSKPAPAPCVPYTTTIYTGADWTPGSVSVTNDLNDLIIDIAADTANGWMFRSVFVYAGQGPTPVDSNNWVDLTKFQYFSYLGTVVPAYEYKIPLTAVGGACGAPLNVSVRTEMEQYDANGVMILSNLAFAYTPNPVVNSGFVYGVCCNDSVNCGCNNDANYWGNHSAATRPNGNSSPWPISESTLLCGKSWLSYLDVIGNDNGSVGANVWERLAEQWIAAKLNVAKGSATSPTVATVMASAGTMVAGNCSSIPAGVTRQTARDYTVLLRHYNRGLLGPKSCKQDH